METNEKQSGGGGYCCSGGGSSSSKKKPGATGDLTVKQQYANANDPYSATSPAAGSQGSRIVEAKVVLLGDSGVGKSSIAQRYCKNIFSESHDVTIGGAYL